MGRVHDYNFAVEIAPSHTSLSLSITRTTPFDTLPKLSASLSSLLYGVKLQVIMPKRKARHFEFGQMDTMATTNGRKMVKAT